MEEHPGFLPRKYPVSGGRADTIGSQAILQEFLLRKPEICQCRSPAGMTLMNIQIKELAQETETSTHEHCMVVGIESRTNPRNTVNPVSC